MYFYRIKDDSHNSNIKHWTSETNSPVATPNVQKIEFATGDEADSVTKHYQLLSNEETKVRVLDTPGLADSRKVGNGFEVIEANRDLFRSILRIQEELKMIFDRVVYFLPTRGCPERADGNLLEELKIMHYFYGSAIFDSMVIVATYHRKKQNEFTDEDKADTKRVLERSLEIVIKSHHKCVSEQSASRSTAKYNDSMIPCPPIEYISMTCNGEDILRALREAPVKNVSGLLGIFCERRCSRCPITILCPNGAPSSEEGAFDVIDSNGKVVDYHDSTCHPAMIPKYSYRDKFIGGIAHVAAGGALIAYEWMHKTKIAFPFFSNSEELCPMCNKPPGAPGCTKVGELCDVELPKHGRMTIQVKHNRKIDKIKSTDSHQLKDTKG